MKYLFLFTTFLWATAALHAQAPAKEQTEPMRELSLITYGRGNADYRDLFIETEPGRFAPLPVLRGSRSAPVDYRGPSQLVIFRRVATEDPENPWRYYPVAVSTIQDSGREFLLLITPRRGNGQRTSSAAAPEFNIAVLPHIQNAIESEHIAFFNGTGAQLLGVLGGEQIILDPGLSQPYSIGNFPPGEGVLVGLTVRFEDSLRPVFHNHIQFSENSRYIMVLLPPERPGSFEIVAFRLAI